MATTINQILSALYDIVEDVTPTIEADHPFQRWESLDDMSLADPSASWRAFRISVASTGKGTLQSGAEVRSKMAKLNLSINYPKGFFGDSDSAFLGIENLRAVDDALLVSELFFKRPNSFQAAVDSVRSLKWTGSTLQGRLWVISFEVDYMEAVT
jgi:hypothetical protein